MPPLAAQSEWCVFIPTWIATKPSRASPPTKATSEQSNAVHNAGFSSPYAPHLHAPSPHNPWHRNGVRGLVFNLICMIAVSLLLCLFTFIGPVHDLIQAASSRGIPLRSTILGIPLCFFGVYIAFTIFLLVKKLKAPNASEVRFDLCPRCKYSREGLSPTAQCPECGFGIHNLKYDRTANHANTDENTRN